MDGHYMEMREERTNVLLLLLCLVPTAQSGRGRLLMYGPRAGPGHIEDGPGRKMSARAGLYWRRFVK